MPGCVLMQIQSKESGGRLEFSETPVVLSAKTVFSKWKITGRGIRVAGNGKGLRKQP